MFFEEKNIYFIQLQYLISQKDLKVDAINQLLISKFNNQRI